MGSCASVPCSADQQPQPRSQFQGAALAKASEHAWPAPQLGSSGSWGSSDSRILLERLGVTEDEAVLASGAALSSSCSEASGSVLGEEWGGGHASACSVECQGGQPLQPSDGGSSCHSACTWPQPCLWVEGLAVGACLSQNAGAAVYRGRWQGAPVAVKVMYTRGSQLSAAAHATEMAVVSGLAHPRVVSAYACLPDLEDTLGPAGATAFDFTIPDAGADDGPGPLLARRFRQAPPSGGAPCGAACNVLIMELCEGGNLRDALGRGDLGAAAAAGAPAASPAAAAAAGFVVAATEVLLDVASALAHLHSMRVVHGAVEAENVLLHADARRRGGFVAKLADFSRTVLLDEFGAPLGLMARLAGGDGGELGVALARCCDARGSASPVDDVRAFGGLIWDLFAASRRPPCQELASLAAACWSPAPPPMADVAAHLARLAGGRATPQGAN
ncbi:hypothetical protein Rsub_05742 [Raphidocelis subcapitata]|uniref:Protein kinase domain-containing protein n=1 Tax=Raphidocelis subcapitata TaxID=307507 RepID=A0A2V0NZ61_9CHLO|nr:hypothetical protein Rsub_05742 [Raphidocelis subcapitata]|eukprot:GBF92906.1 hypothetical protein Rsub_05742 [Raphidocelis subcapitata]